MTCWHCDDSNACTCITCGSDTAKGRAAGKCKACTGRKFREYHRKMYDVYPPELRENWIHHAAADGSKGWEEYVGWKGLSK